MQSKATLHDVSFAPNGRQRVCFELDRKADLSALEGKDIRLEATQWRERRSKDANSYFHVLCQKMADALNTSLTEVKNQMIIDYGQFDTLEDGKINRRICLDSFDYLKCETEHYCPTQAVKVLDDGETYRVFLLKRGSHTYDTKEMSILIEGTISEAQQLGIETITPDEKEELLHRWQIAS